MRGVNGLAVSESDLMSDSNQSVTLRPSAPSDQDFLFAVYASTRQDELSLSAWDEKQKLAFVEMQFNAQNQQYRMSYPEAETNLILIDQRPIGRMIVDDGDQLTLVDIALLPEYRGQGIGSRLIAALLEKASATGKPVSLHVLRYNRAVQLYSRLGFSIIGEDEMYFRMKWTPPSSP